MSKRLRRLQSLTMPLMALPVAAVSIGFSPTVPAFAMQDDAASALPRAEELIDRCITAMGGLEKIKGVKSSHHVMEIDIAGMGDGMKADIFWGDGNKMLIAQSGPMGDMVIGSDGKWVWMSNPFEGGYNLLDESEADQVRNQADFTRTAINLHDQLKEGKATAQTVAELEFDGKKCFNIKVTDKEMQSVVVYFDAATNLISGMEATESDPMMGEMKMIMKFRDYKATDGITNFTTAELDQMGTIINLRISKSEYNNVDAAKFEPPAEVKKMIDERGSADDGEDDGVSASQSGTGST